jgi:adenine-specific DNA-methyltransferase
MKYMGSKRWMLGNGLGHLIQDELKSAKRFVDLFSGSASVAHFAATSRGAVPVIACDIQQFSVVLAGAVITRTEAFDPEPVWRAWHQRARQYLANSQKLRVAEAPIPGLRKGFTQDFVEQERKCCADDDQPISNAYGGYYFSRGQALWIDALRATMPADSAQQSVALAALVAAASTCSASPGHTAQPFRPSLRAKEFLHDAWCRDPLSRTRRTMMVLAACHAVKKGKALLQDANSFTETLEKGDLVFLDPPYSGVHYSRFYHVLETVARGNCGPVDGTGRYPPAAERPRSPYSVASEAPSAIEHLLMGIAEREAKAILTFPQRACSNGLSGPDVCEIAGKYFHVKSTFKRSRFSTLGGTKDEDGNGYGRRARQKTHELILTLTPR